MRATQYDRETAQAFGIPVDRVYAGVFALGAMLAAVAAVLIVPISQAHYLMGLDPLLLSFIVVIIGGLGSLRGTLVAALLIGMSDGIISVFFSPTLAKIIATLVRRAGARLPAAGPVRNGGAMSEAFAGKALAAACGCHRPPVRAALRAAGLSSRRAGARHGAGRLRHGLQSAVRLHRPAQPRPRNVLLGRALWRRAHDDPSRLGCAPAALRGGPRRRCSFLSLASASWRCGPPASPS